MPGYVRISKSEQKECIDVTKEVIINVRVRECQEMLMRRLSTC